MQAGQLDQRVTFYRPVNTRGGYGDDVLSFTVVNTVWAKVTSQKGDESFEAARMEARRLVKILVRFRDDIEVTWRVSWDGQDYDIKDVDRSLKRKGELWLMAQAVGAE
jgi:SPP1 family predicted phage head-tail adaptor